MNSDQIKAHAAGFIHALAVTPALAAKWQGGMSNDERAALIGQHLGLAQAPSANDLQEMANYASANLSDTIAKANATAGVALMILINQS
jgi:cobyrinic acid a,c-diamide synthase